MDNELVRGGGPVGWLLMELRVAQAVVLIRNNPPGVSGAEHARVLARGVRRRDEGLRRRSWELQQELLVARATGGGATEDHASLDPVGSDGGGPGGPDGGSESHDDPLPDAQPPGPPSSLHVDSPPQVDPPDLDLLQALCALQQVRGANRGLETLWLRPGGVSGPVLEGTVCQLLEAVGGVCRYPPRLFPPDLVLRACRVGAGAMDLFCSQTAPPQDFLRRVEGALGELVGALGGGALLLGVQDADWLTECLVLLGGGAMSRSFLIRHILSQISALTDQLWNTFQDPGPAGLDWFPVERYQNASHLLLVLERLLLDSQVAVRVVPGAEPTDFLAHLEGRLFQLSDEFPLFSIYLWKIARLLRSPDLGQATPPVSDTPTW
ncbi:meiosis-specific protein MEI4 [Antennarius striatus]|uniref:meiosis-specific protein MEI4 n=1 Tax=Antennarius striatus TaxID=241820 RepID=UPI0035AF0E17